MTHFRCVAIRNVVAIFEQILFESSTSRTRLPKGAGHEGGLEFGLLAVNIIIVISGFVQCTI